MTLPVKKACDLGEAGEKTRWLIEGVWLDEAVGVVSGEPKTCKTFTVLEMAVAVSSGRPFLRHFPVERPGRVLLFAAEDAPHVIRKRLEVIAGASGLDLSVCDIQVITSPIVRLDIAEHRAALSETIDQLKPRLVILDPFIRLHRVDENRSDEISPLLAYLRSVQKLYNTAIVIVHHARKRAGKARGGQSLRGSSEIHAWLDSHLYLTRMGEMNLRMDIEHRSAESRDGVRLKVVPTDDSLCLWMADPEEAVEPKPEANLETRILDNLKVATAPQSLNSLREVCRTRKSTIIDTLAGLATRGAIVKHADGYLLTK
jgi:hypothetical protein